MIAAGSREPYRHMQEQTLDPQRHLRLMTYNMQVGIRTRHVGEYLARSWRHVLPSWRRNDDLAPVAQMLRGHDLVAIQEADLGSYRTRSVNLLDHLATHAGYPYWHAHGHRRLGPFARHAMGVLSRRALSEVEILRLPGRVPGRAAVIYRLPVSHGHIAIVVTHLALGRADRARQLSHIVQATQSDEHVILMGDLNCDEGELEAHPVLRERGFILPAEPSHSYPSWRPRRQIDHVLVTPGFRLVSASATPFGWSDHLPVQVDVELPSGIILPT